MSRLRLSLVLLVALASAMPAHATEADTSEDVSLVDNHRIRLLTSGRASFAARAKNIASADVVFYKTYAFLDDVTGREAVEALAARARAGAQVFVEYDVKGTASGVRDILGIAIGTRSEIPDHLRPLVEAGVTLIPTNKPRLGSMFLGRDHDKLLVTWKAGEAARAIMGGMNIGDHYRWTGRLIARRAEISGYRDTDVEVRGPEVANVVARFVEAAARAKSPAVRQLRSTMRDIMMSDGAFAAGDLRSGSAARFVHNDPKNPNNRRSIEHLYEQLIRDTPSGETVTISNAYLLPTKRLRKAIMAAVARDVRFRLVINSLEASDAGARLVALALRDQLRYLLKTVPSKNLEVIEFLGNEKRNESSIHQKIAKFGSKGQVIVGSANLDPLSANHNSETVLVSDDHRVRRQFDALIDRTLREGKTRRLDHQSLRRDSFGIKAKGFFFNRVLGRFL